MEGDVGRQVGNRDLLLPPMTRYAAIFLFCKFVLRSVFPTAHLKSPLRTDGLADPKIQRGPVCRSDRAQIEPSLDAGRPELELLAELLLLFGEVGEVVVRQIPGQVPHGRFDGLLSLLKLSAFTAEFFALASDAP